ncbi:hypothetical protein BKH42_07595 [Helicobacter sp. 13S00482-2]|nr:hypothetical protein BKH42_07595 [Helicobacter sp. 13S00482-2]
MYRFKKIYIELSDICGLNCSFCPTPKNTRKIMDVDLFEKACSQSAKLTQIITFHLLGDPCMLKNLREYLNIALSYSLGVDLVTSGVYLHKDQFDILTLPPVHQLSISLNAGFDEKNQARIPANYLKNIFDLCHYKILQDTPSFINLRLQDTSLKILSWLKDAILSEFKIKDDNSCFRFRLGKKVFLNITKTFQWPTLKDASDVKDKYCHGLISQIGILSNGLVVPCCIDARGHIGLGNLKDSNILNIINSPRALKIQEGFIKGEAVEDLCKTCTYPAKRY